MATKHVANREVQWVPLNVCPDFCCVDGEVLPFDIARTLNQDKAFYATTVFARGEPVLMMGSVIQGVVGNAGRGVLSQVSRGSGQVWLREGSPSVYAEKRSLSRHLDECLMNCEMDGLPLDGDIGEALP